MDEHVQWLIDGVHRGEIDPLPWAAYSAGRHPAVLYDWQRRACDEIQFVPEEAGDRLVEPPDDLGELDDALYALARAGRLETAAHVEVRSLLDRFTRLAREMASSPFASIWSDPTAGRPPIGTLGRRMADLSAGLIQEGDLRRWCDLGRLVGACLAWSRGWPDDVDAGWPPELNAMSAVARGMASLGQYPVSQEILQSALAAAAGRPSIACSDVDRRRHNAAYWTSSSRRNRWRRKGSGRPSSPTCPASGGPEGSTASSRNSSRCSACSGRSCSAARQEPAPASRHEAPAVRDRPGRAMGDSRPLPRRRGMAFFEFDEEGRGEFHVGYVPGRTGCRLTTRGGEPAVEWTWAGNDETDPARGRGGRP
jgi:hypothetical protein